VLFHLIEGVEDVITFSLPYRNIAHPLWWMGVAVLLVGIFIMGIPQTSRLLRERFQNSEALFPYMEKACVWIGNNTERGGYHRLQP